MITRLTFIVAIAILIAWWGLNLVAAFLSSSKSRHPRGTWWRSRPRDRQDRSLLWTIALYLVLLIATVALSIGAEYLFAGFLRVIWRGLYP